MSVTARPTIFSRIRHTDDRLLALADQVVVSGCNFATVVILGRVLPIHEFGQFSLAFMAWLFISNLHRAALTQPLNVLGAGDDASTLLPRVAGINRACLALLPLTALLLALASWLFFPDPWLFATALAFVAAFMLQETYRRYCYTAKRYASALVNDSISYGGQLVLLVLLAASGQLTALSAFAALAVTSIAALLWSWREHGKALWRPAMALGALRAEHRPIAGWLLLTVLAVWGAGQVYPFLMAPLGATVVAAFAACRNLLNVLGVVVQTITNYVPTHVAALMKHQGVGAVVAHLKRSILWAILASALFLCGALLLAQPLLHLVYGGKYDEAADVLRVLSFGTVCSLLGTLAGAYAIGLGDSRSGFYSNLAASAMTFTMGLWLLGEHGLLGAAIATSLSLATAAVFQAGFLYRRLRSGGPA